MISHCLMRLFQWNFETWKNTINVVKFDIANKFFEHSSKNVKKMKVCHSSNLTTLNSHAWYDILLLLMMMMKVIMCISLEMMREDFFFFFANGFGGWWVWQVNPRGDKHIFFMSFFLQLINIDDKWIKSVVPLLSLSRKKYKKIN